MTFLSKDELANNIKFRSRLSLVSSFSECMIVISFVFFVLFVISKMVLASAICCFVCCLCIAASVIISRYHKKETSRLDHFPYEIILAHKFEYDHVKQILSQQAKPELCRDFQNDSAFFCFLHLVLDNRFLVVNASQFDKTDFDAKRKKINKAINKEFKVTQWAPIYEASKKMRTNIIVTDEVNESLYTILSRNAGTLLRRAEGIVSFAIAGDRLIIPPLFGEIGIPEINRYKKSIRILTMLLK